jgi:hypothetical protein
MKFKLPKNFVKKENMDKVIDKMLQDPELEQKMYQLFLEKNFIGKLQKTHPKVYSLFMETTNYLHSIGCNPQIFEITNDYFMYKYQDPDVDYKRIVQKKVYLQNNELVMHQVRVETDHQDGTSTIEYIDDNGDLITINMEM